MAITHEQKADIGVQYLAQLRERIKTREAAQKKAATEAKTLDDNSELLREMAEVIIKQYHLGSNLAKAEIESRYGRGGEVLEVTMNNGVQINVPVSLFISLKNEQSAVKKASHLSHTLCSEIEFLHGLLNKTATFQAHVARLWAPESKDVLCSASSLKSFLEDFIAASRPAVCAVA